MKIICLLLLFCVGCGKAGYPIYVEPELKPYVSQYATYKLKYIGKPYQPNIFILFDKLKFPTVGMCTTYNDYKYKVIQVDYTFWVKASEAQREILMFHELGHCDLRLDHTDEDRIMNPQLLGGDYYLDNKEFLINSLFIEGM